MHDAVVAALTLAAVRGTAAAAALLLGAVPVAVHAQDDSRREIHGRVVDTQGFPVAGARIEAIGVAATDHSSSAAADGRYTLILNREAFTLRISARGFRTHSVDVPPEREHNAGRSLQLDITLEPAPYRLAGISVTGRTRAEIAATPGALAVLDEAILHERAPLSVMDALHTVPGVHITDEDPFGLNLNIGFRGLPPRRSSRTLLLEDGVPILLGPYGDPSMHYAPPVEALERIEVLKGSGQIVNGPQTVGGIINFVTRRPPVQGTESSLVAGAGAHGYRNGHLWVGTTVGRAGIALDHTYREGSGVRTEHAHRIHNSALSALLPLADGHSLLAKVSVWDEASRISETGLTQAEFEADPWSLPFSAAGRFDVRRYAGQLVHELESGRVLLRTMAYMSHTDRASWRQSGESEERLGEDGYAEAFNCEPGATSYDACGNQGRPRIYRVTGLEPRASIDLGGINATLDAGARLYRETAHRRQYTGSTPTSRRSDAVLTHDNRIETDAVAGYVHARMRLGSLALSPGLRVEHLWQDVRNLFPGREAEVDVRHTQLLPGIGATWDAGAGATLFAGAHRGFAPPRPADIYRPEPGQPVVLVDAETTWNWELGARFESRVGVSAEATLFRLDFGNQIIEAPANAGQRFTNGGRTVHQGVEVGGDASLGSLLAVPHDFVLSAAFTWLPTARFRSDDERGAAIAGNRLPYAPRSTVSASGTFTHASGITVGTSIAHTGTQFADAENTVEPSDDGQSGVLPAYTVVNAFAAFAIPGTPLRLRASARNLFNSVYVTQRNEGIYTGMRRLIRAEVQWTLQEQTR